MAVRAMWSRSGWWLGAVPRLRQVAPQTLHQPDAGGPAGADALGGAVALRSLHGWSCGAATAVAAPAPAAAAAAAAADTADTPSTAVIGVDETPSETTTTKTNASKYRPSWQNETETPTKE